jgi:hypothetical protein
MADLTTTQKAMLLDGADQPLLFSAYAAVSSDPAIVSVVTMGSALGVAGNAAGSADITVTRSADGLAVTNTVTVEGSSPFTWHLAAPEPK